MGTERKHNSAILSYNANPNPNPWCSWTCASRSLSQTLTLTLTLTLTSKLQTLTLTLLSSPNPNPVASFLSLYLARGLKSPFWVLSSQSESSILLLCPIRFYLLAVIWLAGNRIGNRIFFIQSGIACCYCCSSKSFIKRRISLLFSCSLSLLSVWLNPLGLGVNGGGCGPGYEGLG